MRNMVAGIRWMLCMGHGFVSLVLYVPSLTDFIHVFVEQSAIWFSSCRYSF